MFKKTVNMHEVFLRRLAAHPQLRNDSNFKVFLEFNGDVSLFFKTIKNEILYLNFKFDS